MGDCNLNLMTYQSHNLTGEFLDMMYSNTFLPLITCPTTIRSHCATLIDNIFQNSFSKLICLVEFYLPKFLIIYLSLLFIMNIVRTMEKENPLFSFVIKIRKMCLNFLIHDNAHV